MLKTATIILLAFFALALSVFPTTAQERLDGSGFSCGFGNQTGATEVYAFKSTHEARSIIYEILAAVGLKANFEVRAANTANAEAKIIDNVRLILYNEQFIQQIKLDVNNDWAATYVLAHEIGHHLNGHSLDGKGSKPPIELEADEFSGFVLYKLGASLEDALSGTNVFSEVGSTTHPPRSERRLAITNGYKRAEKQGNLPSVNRSTSRPQSGTAALGDACIKNPNMYARKVVLTSKSDKTQTELLIGQSSDGCLYEIKAGVYSCQVFTTFSKALIGTFDLRIKPNDSITKELVKDHKN